MLSAHIGFITASLHASHKARTAHICKLRFRALNTSRQENIGRLNNWVTICLSVSRPINSETRNELEFVRVSRAAKSDPVGNHCPCGNFIPAGRFAHGLHVSTRRGTASYGLDPLPAKCSRLDRLPVGVRAGSSPKTPPRGFIAATGGEVVQFHERGF